MGRLIRRQLKEMKRKGEHLMDGNIYTTECKNCIHDCVCPTWNHHTDDFAERDAKSCKNFKHKELFIKLPWVVGGYMYTLEATRPHIKKRRITDIRISTYGINLCSFGAEYPSSLIGKKVFFNVKDVVEACDKLLKERREQNASEQ